MQTESRVFVGRGQELEAVRRVLELARSGLSGALVIRGEAGVGKTALVDAAIAGIDELRVARVVGIESEAVLDYAALHGVLVPFLDGLECVPPPQRAALCAAFGLEAGPAPSPMLVSLAALTLLANAAVQRRLVLVIDDAQWLDPESARVLAFVARRLYADGIAMLFCVREPSKASESLDGLLGLDLAGLPTDQALELLGSIVAGQRIDDGVGRRLVAQTSGNPLALLEVVDELTPEQLTGRALLPDPLPIGRGLEELHLASVRTLAPATQTLLLIAAAEPSGDAALVWRAATLLGVDHDAAAPAEAEHLLVGGTVIEFRHPLTRSAVYQGAACSTRRRVHEALAAADKCESHRRAWHRAAAAVAPDEDIAIALERSAERACSRDGYPAAARLLARAAELTADERHRTGRLLAAASAALTAGDTLAAESLLANATPGLKDPTDQAESLRLQGGIHFSQRGGGESFLLLMAAARAVGPSDPRRARDTLFEALEAATWTSREATFEAARAVRTAPVVADATTRDHLLEAFAARLLDGFVAAAPLYRRAVDAAMAETEDLRVFHLACIAAGELWDLGAFRALSGRWVELARARGALGILPLGNALHAAGELLVGRYGDEHAGVVDGIQVSKAFTGILGEAGAGENLLLAWTGPEPAGRTAVEAHIRRGLEQGGYRGYGVVFAELALSQLELGLRNYESALVNAARVYEADFLGPASAWSIADLVEAAHRAGDRQAARAGVQRLAERAMASGTTTALGLLARAQAVLAPDENAEDFYREAIEQLERSPARSDLARAHLLYGEWLRRCRRRCDARRSLRTAYEMFDAAGAEFFAERARAELVATGERARRRVDDTRDDLTPQELQIAQFVVEGLSNREIAAQLFISPSTVAYHLRHVFRKLDVTARMQLRDALPDLVV